MAGVAASALVQGWVLVGGLPGLVGTPYGWVALAKLGLLAVLLGFADGRRGYSYINGVDQTVPGQSFGTLAFACAIEDALVGGAGEFHFLRGEETYKYAWGAEARTTVRRRVVRAEVH